MDELGLGIEVDVAVLAANNETTVDHLSEIFKGKDAEFWEAPLALRAWAVVCADRYSPVEFWWHDPQVQALNLTQRNLSLQSGVDPVDLDQHFYGVHGDWETQRHFSGFGYKHVKDQSSDYEEQFVQNGITPYLGDYGNLHIWLMLKCKKNTL